MNRYLPRNGIEKFPVVGIFATRFPSRPNPIGVAVVELISVEKSLIKVKGLDAWTGTPVLDIKPYDYFDIVKKLGFHGGLKRCGVSGNIDGDMKR